ncbi:DNA polymerase III alpha chain [Buchnera aphidicola (Nipponaphis monzeni)]|uniref:DNA polymerase III subunit alpha n=1 Tax=Buchnera aphidicola (Nipponaphis monzeni) TaxID=2495405 RepID=A0A455TA45_9GAMM|nr:DNA polymerase III subunit alpha [Buchnera aphidicola]BBI01202.1 DNA polymerase III alpha chain [Buchnera aphidicola (Nipponaphis monzeni)]
MMTPKFIHLKLHTEYSMVDGLSNPYDIIKAAEHLNMPAISVTDKNNLFGVLKFYNLAHKHGIKPILGVDFDLCSNNFQNQLTKITLLATDYVGYQNLIFLISKSYQNKKSHKKVFITKEWLSNYNNGLIVLLGGCYGEIGKNLICNDYKSSLENLFFYKKMFPKSYYLEITRTGRINEEIYLKRALKFALSNKIPLIATNDVCFIYQRDFKAHQIRIAINRGLNLNNLNTLDQYTNQQYLRSEQEMCELFKDVPQALKNSVEIAKRCNVILCFKKYFLPKFNTGTITAEKFLINESKYGLRRRLNKILLSNIQVQETYLKYKNRLLKELNIINKMGFSGYFLIIMEFVRWAKKNDIPVGPGRGSGAGSLVAYTLGITELDPIKFNLLFERFLNPERIDLPDFDIDFCMEGRDNVIEHIANLYGQEAVSQIITFGTMTAKSVIRDVGRVFGYPYGFINRISKLIPNDPGITLKSAFSNNLELINYYNEDQGVRSLINMAKKLEGVVRNVGKHAGGIIISPEKITNYLPLYYDEHSKNSLTQFDKTDIEKIGLVKFDILGLRTLTIIKWAVDSINSNNFFKKNELVNINSIDLNDINIFKYLNKANTIAIFQLESIGMRDLIKRLHPDTFEDLIALIALFRPGPLQSGMVDNFINRKHGKELICYPDSRWQHKLLKPILEPTYGIILYQEQVMQIAQVLSGFTLGKADILRRAMSKKDPIEMSKQRSIFVEGTLKLGINKQLSIKIFDLLEKFAGYGFNKSHSAAYALISYQTLWLKYYYPSAFMAAVMTSEIHNVDKIFILINECYTMNIKILPPDINKSVYNFIAIGNNCILYGMGAIKGIGKGTISSIINIRTKGKKFFDLFDLCVRMKSFNLTQKMIEKLIMSGACDCFNQNRYLLAKESKQIIQAVKQYLSVSIYKQSSLFGSLISQYNSVKFIKNVNYKQYLDKNKFLNEHKVLGLYLTGHPINQYLKELKYYTGGLRLNEINKMGTNKKIMVFGIISSVKFKLLKNSKKMAILLLDDNSNRLEIIIFGNLIDEKSFLLNIGTILIVVGHWVFDKFYRTIKIIASDIIDIETIREKFLSQVIINLHTNELNNNFYTIFKQILQKHNTGKVPIIIRYTTLDIQITLQLGNEWKIFPTNKLFNKLKLLVGANKIFLKLKKISKNLFFCK